jgi:hypothetical protein
MIGVIVDPADHLVVREFFELFKTPWEFYSADRQYAAVLSAGDSRNISNARVIIYYSGKRLERDRQDGTACFSGKSGSKIFLHEGSRIPIYGNAVTFANGKSSFLIDEESQRCAAYRDEDQEPVVVRVGYDLFQEALTLLTVGQPTANAIIPTLDLHIALLRDIITGCGLSLLEIPPVPAGYGCIACLTHDVDHPSIRRHRWDHTMFGFVYRAIFGSLSNLTRRRIRARDLFSNWAAVLKLPFVYLGLAKDFWRNFDDSYLRLENGIPSTFFVIPFKLQSGKTSNGSAPSIRAAGYGAQDIADLIEKLTAAGCEVGLHGIDAWTDVSKGREEFAEIRRLVKSSQVGVRMHWLYSDRNSPARLETAGAEYDSTSGYNETVGYRAGTAQVFKPLNTTQMLELPLHAMDTALFYPSYLGLSEREAVNLIRQLADNACRLGGTITVNWHDRSLAPERLWGDCYSTLIKDLKKRDAWFATGAEAVSWFQKRRSASFVANPAVQGGTSPKILPRLGDELPPLRLRVHLAQTMVASGMHDSDRYVDSTMDSFFNATVALEAGQ